MNYRQIDKLIFKYIIIIAGLTVIIFNLRVFFSFIDMLIRAFSHIFWAIILAYVINIMMSKIEKYLKKVQNKIIIQLKRPISLFISIGLIVVICLSLIQLIVPEFLKAISVLTQTTPTYFNQLQDFLTNIFKNIPYLAQAIDSIEINWKNLFSNLLSFAGTGVGNFIGTTFNLVSIITNSLFNFLLIFIFALYLLLEKDRFIRLYKRLTNLFLSPYHQSKLNLTLTIIHQSFRSFISGQCIEAVILGLLCTLGMLILRLPYAPMIGTLVGTINIIPIVGAYIGGAIGAFMVFTVSLKQAFVFLLFLCILQQIESHLIYPKVVGNSVGLPGIYVLASVMVFGTLAGIPGMFLGIPIVASIYKLGRLYIRELEEKRMLHLKNKAKKDQPLS